MRLNRFISGIGIGMLLLASCSKSDTQSKNSVSEADSSQNQPAILSYEGRTAEEKTTYDKISAEDNGFMADMDGDGISDFVKMGYRMLYFQHRNQDQSYSNKVVLVQIQGDVRAYRIEDIAENGKFDGKPDFVFFKPNADGVTLDGYVQRNMGTINGIPSFHPLESYSEK